MRLIIVFVLFLCLPMMSLAQQKPRRLFPYKYTIDDLSNGLRLITVPTDYPNLVALYIVVQTGSRNEIEPGKSGYAHLFEHLMFRGSENFTGEQRDAILKRAGSESNAYTSDDRTVYHEVFSKEDLDQIMHLEADRFQHLKYSAAGYRTETLAVKGEYNKNSANPSEKLFEVLRETAYRRHTYSHTTMGYVKDIDDMPNQYEYSLQFFQRYYRPEYTTIVLVGDVTREHALQLVTREFGGWKRGTYVPEIPTEPEQAEALTAHIDWPSATLPYMVVAFRGPAYSDSSKDKAALDLLAQVAFGENSDLYQRMVLTEQKVDLLDVSFDDRKDPELFAVYARIKEPKDMEYVRDQILATYRRYKTELIPRPKLDQTRSRLRYGAALSLDSSSSIADALAPYIGLRRSPDTVDKLFALYDQITPEDVRAAASRYFLDNQRTIVTLTTDASRKEARSR